MRYGADQRRNSPLTHTSVPASTMQVAKAALPMGCLAMHMRDELGAIYNDQMFAEAC